jgi:tRNA (cmo5U34)-methyltransferase
VQELQKRVKRDSIYSHTHDLIENFRFDKEVVGVFEDMISRSVPGYGMVLSLVGVLAETYLQEQSRGYDLGTSLGGATLAMRKIAEERGCELVAVDNSTAMVEQCRKSFSTGYPVELRCEDLRDTTVENASLVIMNFTLQFIPLAEREAILHKIATGINAGGAFMLSEKINFNDPEQQQRINNLHHSFKRANGYSEMEISQKRSALEDVLVSETVERHIERLHKVGFNRVQVIFQALNFVSILALR